MFLHPVTQISITVLDESNHHCPTEETTATVYRAEGTHNGELLPVESIFD